MSNSTCIPNLTGGGRAPDSPPSPLLREIQMYVLPGFAIVGLVGNATAFAVFVITYIRKRSFSIFLAALSITDIVYLVCLLMSWSATTGISRFWQRPWCGAIIFFSSTSSNLNAVYLLAATVDLYVAIKQPQGKLQLCSYRKAKIIVIITAVNFALVFSYLLPMIGPRSFAGVYLCGPNKKHETAIRILDDLDSVLIFLLLCVIIMLNMRIIRETMRRMSEPSEGRHRHSSACSSTRLSTPESVEVVVHKSQLRIIRLIVITSFVLVGLKFPRQSMLMYAAIRRMLDPGFAFEGLHIAITNQFDFLNHLKFVINLMLFIALSKHFRQASRWLVESATSRLEQWVGNQAIGGHLYGNEIETIELPEEEIEMQEINSLSNSASTPELFGYEEADV